MNLTQPTERFDTLAEAEDTLKHQGFKLVPDTCNWISEDGHVDAGVYAVEGRYGVSKFRIEYRTLKTTAPASAGLARRAFMAGLAVTLPIAATAATPVLAAAGGSRSEIDDLYAARTELAAQSRELCARYVAATESLPWWAQSGYEYLCGDGTWTGALVGWPATDDIKALNLTRLLKRPSPRTFQKEFESYIRYYGEEHRPEFRATYRRQMRDLVARLRRQREEESKAGIPVLEAQMDTLDGRIESVNNAIDDLEVSAADIPQKAAAIHLIALTRRVLAKSEIGPVAVLETLRPMLSGLILEHVDFAARDWQAPICEMPFWAA